MSRYLIDQLATRSNINDDLRSADRGRSRRCFAGGDRDRRRTTGSTTRLDSGGLFVFIGADADTAWLPPEIALDEKGYVLTGPDVRSAERWELDRDPYLLETSVPGIFACGDVRFSQVKRVAAAVGEGSMAIAFVHQYLKDAASESSDGASSGARLTVASLPETPRWRRSSACSTTIPSTGIRPSYPRDDIPTIERYFDGQTTPTPAGGRLHAGRAARQRLRRARAAALPRGRAATGWSSPPTRTGPTRRSSASCPTPRS